MTRTRGGILGATVGLTAIVAVQTVLPVAKADELADLRANQLLLQQRIDQLAQATKEFPGQAGPKVYGQGPAPTTPSFGGSFPRSFLIPGTETSIRVGGRIDFTVLDFLQGGGNVNGSNYGSNAGQNGNVHSLPVAGGFVPGLGFVNPNATNRAPGRNNGVLEFSPQQSRFNIETRTPTSWGEARTFFEWDWAGCDNFSCQDVAQSGNNQLTRLRFAYGTLGGFLAGQALSNFSDADADTEFDGFRRRRGRHRRSAHPPGALYLCAAVVAQLPIGFGGKPTYHCHHPGWRASERLRPVWHWIFDHSAFGGDRTDLQRPTLHRRRHGASQPGRRQSA